MFTASVLGFHDWQVLQAGLVFIPPGDGRRVSHANPQHILGWHLVYIIQPFPVATVPAYRAGQVVNLRLFCHVSPS
jgi:hypothetical protein